MIKHVFDMHLSFKTRGKSGISVQLYNATLTGLLF